MLCFIHFCVWDNLLHCKKSNILNPSWSSVESKVYVWANVIFKVLIFFHSMFSNKALLGLSSFGIPNRALEKYLKVTNLLNINSPAVLNASMQLCTIISCFITSIFLALLVNQTYWVLGQLISLYTALIIATWIIQEGEKSKSGIIRNYKKWPCNSLPSASQAKVTMNWQVVCPKI